MCAENIKVKKRNIVSSIVTDRCPRCREGKLFINPNPYALKTTMRMYEHCPVCGLKYERETGFFFGTGYVSYGLSVMFIMLFFLAWHYTIGLSASDNSIFICLALSGVILVLAQPLLQRISRSIWIACFVRYDPNWIKHSGLIDGESK